METDARDVRAGEQLDWTRLTAWLRERLPACGVPGLDVSREPTVAQFPGGHSNLTYLVRFGDTDIVVRRPPFGPVAPTAHDMAREFRWLSAMHRVFPLAPRPYLLCEDTSVIGAVFYAMERRRGIVVRVEEPPALANPAARTRLSGALIDTLADLHAIDVNANGLQTLGKPAGFVERQVRGWTERWQRSRTDALPEMDALATWLREHLPGDPASPSVVHGDFKLDNVMLDPDDVGRLVAVFDWEMSALGDPLDGAARAARRADDGHGSAGLFHARRNHRALRGTVGPGSVGHPLLRDLRGVQDRRRDSADLLPVRAGPDDRRALRGLRRARSIHGRTRRQVGCVTILTYGSQTEETHGEAVHETRRIRSRAATAVDPKRVRAIAVR